MPMVRQLFFDCDNTLVLSEDVAFEACADLINEILAGHHHTPDRYTSEKLIAEFIGQNFRGILKSLQAKYKFEITPEQVNQYVKREEEAVVSKLNNACPGCDGAHATISKLWADSPYDIAVVSSSAKHRIIASLHKAGFKSFIPLNHIFSAATSLSKSCAKPNPDIYLHAMEQMGVTSESCVTVEDSKSGAVAAVRAGIRCIAYVGAYRTKEKQNEVARTMLSVGCVSVMYHWNDFFECLRSVESL